MGKERGLSPAPGTLFPDFEVQPNMSQDQVRCFEILYEIMDSWWLQRNVDLSEASPYACVMVFHRVQWLKQVRWCLHLQGDL